MKTSNICKFTFPQEAGGLSIPCFVLESDHRSMANDIHLKHHCAILVIQGKGDFIFSKTKYTASIGSLIFGFKGEIFTARPDEQCQYMYIHFDGKRAEELLYRFDITPQNRNFEGFDGIIPLWKESLASASEKTIDLASESILLYTFSRLFKNSTSRDTLINKILKFSEENFTNPELSLAAVSDELGYNPKYISHLFKEKMNISYSEYLRNLRIKYAVSLFDHGIDSVKSVALLSGFTDPLYFSAVFKKSLGISPTDYKSRIEKG